MGVEDVRRAEEAFAKVVADFAPLDKPPSWNKDFGPYLRSTWGEDSVYDEMDQRPNDAELLVIMADKLQDEISNGPGDTVWPVCPAHNFGLHPEVRGGVAVWRCRPGDHTVSAIGELCGTDPT